MYCMKSTEIFKSLGFFFLLSTVAHSSATNEYKEWKEKSEKKNAHQEEHVHKYIFQCATIQNADP